LIEAEDTKHALFSCSRAREVWFSLGMWDQIEKLLLVDRSSGSVMIREIIRQGSLATEFNVGLPEILITDCWYICWQRRQVVCGDEIQIAPRAAMSIAAITTNYALAPKASTVINNKWKKPRRGSR